MGIYGDCGVLKNCGTLKDGESWGFGLSWEMLKSNIFYVGGCWWVQRWGERLPRLSQAGVSECQEFTPAPEKSRNHLRSHGISPIKSSKIRIRPLPLLFKVDIIGVYRYCNLYPRALAMVASGKINLKPLISKTFQLEVSDCPSQGGFARSTPRLWYNFLWSISGKLRICENHHYLYLSTM